MMNPTASFVRAVFADTLVWAFPSWGASKPNRIFIMADDRAHTDVGCFGSKYYETPNVDRLASQGNDLGETKNLVASETERTKARLAAWRAAIKAPMRTANK